jgi:hypothetical protein
VPSRFVRRSVSPAFAPALGQIRSGCTVPTTASPYFGLAVADRVPPRKDGAGLTNLLGRPGENLPEDLHR